jgi:hypothetical protein
MRTFLDAPKVYRFEGVLFEVGYPGPWPLTKDGTPKTRVPGSFWELFKRFDKLSDEQKEEYRVGGGSMIL